MPTLTELVSFCDTRCKRAEYTDFPGAFNGLQVANRGEVTRIGAAVDASLETFRLAAEAGVDFLIAHHGMYWDQPRPLVGSVYEKVKLLLEANCAVYGSHLPLDGDPEIGNAAVLANRLGLEVLRTAFHHEGKPIGLVVRGRPRTELNERLEKEFPRGFTALEFGSEAPAEVAILTGSGSSVVGRLAAEGVDTLITGELRQNHFAQAQEERLNLYLCGHYATEVYGVKALAAEASAQFGVPWQFLDTGCPL
jgi:dinuclear metal center YbgI/SA1388 family protein